MTSNGAPRVSIIMPAYQHAAHIGETVRSVLAQSLADWELLVVDDGSSDGTGDVVTDIAERSADPRIQVRRTAHAGVSVARNTALAAARGEYVAFLDADDPWPPDRLAALVAALDADPGAGLVYTDRLEIDDAGRPIRLRVAPGRVATDDLLHGFPFAPSDGLVRGTWARRSTFPAGVVINEDRDYFFRLHVAGCAMRKVDAPLSRRRRYPGRTFADLERLLADRLRVLDRALGHPGCPAGLRRRREELVRGIHRDRAWTAVEARNEGLARRWIGRGVDHREWSAGRRDAGGRRDAIDRWLVWSSLRHGDDPEPVLRWFFDHLPPRLRLPGPAGDRIVRAALLRAGLREHLWGRTGRAASFLERAGTGAPVVLVEAWLVRQLARLDTTTPADRVPAHPAARARIVEALDGLGPAGQALADRFRAPAFAASGGGVPRRSRAGPGC